MDLYTVVFAVLCEASSRVLEQLAQVRERRRLQTGHWSKTSSRVKDEGISERYK